MAETLLKVQKKDEKIVAGVTRIPAEKTSVNA